MWHRLSPLLRKLLLFRKTFVILLTPLILLPLPLINNIPETRCAYIILLMAVYWITEAVPLSVTAGVPIFAFPLAGVVSSQAIGTYYVTETSIMFVGGLIVAVAIEHCNLHRRMAMLIILRVGQSPRLIMAGFMITAMFLSMWISNTAATTIMVTVVEGIIDLMNEEPSSESKLDEECGSNFDTEHKTTASGITSSTDMNTGTDSAETTKSSEEANIEYTKAKEERDRIQKSKYGYYLAVMYAANIGGTGVITGTPSNMLVFAVLTESFTEPTGVTFTSWMMFNIPGMIVSGFVGWLWLQYNYIGFGKNSISVMKPEKKEKIQKLIQQEYKNLGPMTYHEKTVSILFMLLIPLWVFRAPGFIYGWGTLIEDLYGEHAGIGDSVPVIFIVFLFFILPSENPFRKKRTPEGALSVMPSEGIVTWQLVQEKVAWGLIILLGGGVAMAKGSDASGLSKWAGAQLQKMGGMSPPVLLVLVTGITSIVTELMSNTAAISVMLPVLREMSFGLCTNPLYFMMTATTTACFAFMLPVATPANAVVYFASGIPSTEMIKVGFVMNLLCIIIVNISANTLGVAVFDFHNMPSWVNSSTSGAIPSC